MFAKKSFVMFHSLGFPSTVAVSYVGSGGLAANANGVKPAISSIVNIMNNVLERDYFFKVSLLLDTLYYVVLIQN